MVRKLLLVDLFFLCTFKLKNAYPTIRRNNIFMELLLGFNLILAFSIKCIFLQFCVVPKVRRKRIRRLN